MEPRKIFIKKPFSDSENNFFTYNFRRFFIFNLLKSFPKIFINFHNKYTARGQKYIFTKNRPKFRTGFYNSFLHIYRKFPSLMFIKNLLSSFVNKFFGKTKFTFILSSEKFISANLVKNFILDMMSDRFRLGRVVFAVIRFLNDFRRKGIIRGFRILLAGRFTKKDRATFYWKKRGFLSFNNRMGALDYSFGTKVLRYSLCVCKI